MIVDLLKRAYKIGSPLAFGTDIVIYLPGLNRVQSSFKVLETWKAAEILASYISQTMTLYAAELLGIEKERGLLIPSYYANIVAFKNNPLVEIENIKSVHFVMKEGEIIKND
ncbi:MAG: imidazolonepropionase-like amidohydrolase [Marivirga sp.]